MILYDFDLERPNTLEEASALLRDKGADARVLAGGTDLLPNMRVEVVRPATVVSLSAITPRDPVRETDGTVRIDALTRLATLEGSDLIRAACPMLAEAAHRVAGNQIRQMGTLGGNLCQETRCLYYNQKHDYQFKAPCYKRGGEVCYPYPNNDRDTCWSVYMSDTAPALIALGAEVEIVGPGGTRRQPVEQLFTGSGLTPHALGAGEILSAVIVPPAPARFGWGYCKSSRRGGLEFGMAVMAVTLTLDADGATCGGARMVIGAVREKPIRLTATEQAMTGAKLDEAKIAELAGAAAKEINPLPHHGFTKSYIRDNIKIHLRRALSEAIARARGTGAAGNGGHHD